MFISSDTNIWFDFEAIGHLEHPFLLNHSYFISDFTDDEEINSSEGIKKIVTSDCLQVTSVNNQELALVNKLTIKYKNLSFYDLVALAIAIKRKWVLLTGDGLLRNAAVNEKIECHGSIWIYDQLIRDKKISKSCYNQCLLKLLDLVKQGKRRLPLEELVKRINTNYSNK